MLKTIFPGLQAGTRPTYASNSSLKDKTFGLYSRERNGSAGGDTGLGGMESFFATLKKGLICQLPLYKMARDEVCRKAFA